jgi:NTE family protein
VIALRDSEVVRIPRQTVEQLMRSSPELMLYVVRLLVDRLRRSQRPPLPQATKVVAFIPVDDRPLEQNFAERMQMAFLSLSVRIGLIGGTNSHLTAEAIAAIEEQHDLVLYIGDRRCSAWSSRCLRQADHVVFVSDADYAPDMDTDKQIGDARRLHRTADLMLLNNAEAIEANGATRWLGRFAPDRIFHVRRGGASDFARVARLTTGRAVGLLLSGGGARGFAHIGAIRALETAGIPIDLVAGTSMGAIIGAAAAADLRADEITKRVRRSFVETNPVNDYTLPLISLTRGRKMARLLREQCGVRTIENQWKNFFCVSSNLSTGQIFLHRHGLVWQALRASAAIPGVFPPFIEEGHVLVDGGIMNNFPADIMSSQARGVVVGVDVVAGTPFFAKATDLEEKSLLWRLRNRAGVVPGIGSVLVRSATVGSEAQTVLSRSKVDVLIQPRLDGIEMLSFQSIDAAVEFGYRATSEAIDRIETRLK